MEKGAFQQNNVVAGFIDWLCETLPTIPVHLKIKSSKYVKGGINKKCIGIEEVKNAYQWQSSCPWQFTPSGILESNDWLSTRITLQKLSDKLKCAIE